MDETKNENKSPSQDSWAFFFQYAQKAWKKIAWVITIAFGIFCGGIWLGRFYEELQNKFEISELKTQHSGEIEKLRNDFIMNQLKELKETQNNIIQVTDSKEVKNEK